MLGSNPLARGGPESVPSRRLGGELEQARGQGLGVGGREQDACLAHLDVVIASVHSAIGQEADEITARICRAIANPWVDVVGHPTSRLLLRRSPSRADIGQMIAAAAAHGVALEINSQIDRLDLPDVHARLARDRGVPLVISSDAHSTAALRNTRWGVTVARRAWLRSEDVLTTRPLDAFRRSLRRHRAR